MTIPNKPSYTHGSAGSVPAAPIDYVTDDPVNPEHFDYFIHTEFDYIKSIIDALNAIDSNDDGKVDAADQADDATNVTSTYKNNDIDTDGDGQVNNANAADKTLSLDGSDKKAGALPQFGDVTTGLNNTSSGDIFFNTTDNSAYLNDAGSEVDITKKGVGILVNGSHQASYEQRADGADYDVSVSPTQGGSNIDKYHTDSATDVDGGHSTSFTLGYEGTVTDRFNIYVEIIDLGDNEDASLIVDKNPNSGGGQVYSKTKTETTPSDPLVFDVTVDPSITSFTNGDHFELEVGWSFQPGGRDVNWEIDIYTPTTGISVSGVNQTITDQ